MSLLKEINDLRSELKKSRTTAHDLEAILKIARKQGFDDQAAYASAKPVLPPTGLAKIEPTDNSRIIEMQKAEISRLRAKIRDLERGLHRPPSGGKLPPMQQPPEMTSPLTAAPIAVQWNWQCKISLYFILGIDVLILLIDGTGYMKICSPCNNIVYDKSFWLSQS